MKNLLYVVFVSILFFAFLVATNGLPNPVGAALQQWLSLILVLILPLSSNTALWKRILALLPLALIFSIIGASWAGYSDLGGVVFFFYSFIILNVVIVSHYVLKFLNSANAPRHTIKILYILIAISLLAGAIFVVGGISKYNQLVQQFNTACKTGSSAGHILTHCGEQNYMRFFPPNNHISF